MFLDYPDLKILYIYTFKKYIIYCGFQLANSTDKIPDNYIRDLRFNSRLDQKLIGVFI